MKTKNDLIETCNKLQQLHGNHPKKQQHLDPSSYVRKKMAGIGGGGGGGGGGSS